MTSSLLRRLAFCLLACLGALPELVARPAHAQLDLSAPGAAVVNVRINQRALSPSVIQVFGPTDLVWTNDSGVTVVLRSGLPASPGTTIFLPYVSQQESAQLAQVLPRANTATVDFSVTLPPGARFMKRYTAPGSYHFHVVGGPAASGQIDLTGTGLLTSSPLNGEDGVAPTRETIISFNGALNPATVTKSAFFAQAGGSALDFRLHLSKDARQVTLFYSEPLPGNARVRVSIDGAILRAANGAAVDVNNDNLPGGLAVLEFDTLSLSLIPDTSVCGRVFASELAANGSTSVNTPLVGATITVDGRENELRTTTNGTGNFCLNPAPAGRFFVHIDGRSATNGVPAGSYYPFVGKTWEAAPGVQSNIGDVFLPLVVPGTLQPVSQVKETVIHFAPSILAKFPQFADVAITVPAESLFNDDGTPGGLVGIAPVPADRIPGALPEELDFPLVITVQTDGAGNFDTPAPVCFPNLPNPNTGVPLKPGERSALWSFNHDTGRFAVVGPMTATADGKLVCTDPGVGVPAPGWHSWSGGTPGRGGPMQTVEPEDEADILAEEEEEEELTCEEQGGEEVCKQRKDFTPSVNGCGPQWLIDDLAEYPWAFGSGDLELFNNPMEAMNGTEFLYGGCDFRSACNTHDIGYAICQRPKQATDTQFLGDLLAACSACYPASNPLNAPAALQCEAYARSFHQAVVQFGALPYSDAQEEACDCQCEVPAGAGALSPFRELAPAQSALAQQTDEVPLSRGIHYYAVLNLEANLIQRGTAGSNGIAFENDLVLAPNTPYRIMLLEAASLREGYVTFVTPAAGESFTIPSFAILPMQGFDIDADGLGALGEFVMNTDPFDADVDGDGILDGAEIRQGSNPLGNQIVQTGVIGSADTPGTATDVCVQGDLAVVADGAEGVAIFNAFAGMNPLIIAQVTTPGPATAVACDRAHVVAATGSAGISIIDILTGTMSAISRQTGFGGQTAVSVAAANGVAYVGLGNGTVARVNLATGALAGQLAVATDREIQDLALMGDYLYALTLDDLYAIALDTFTVSGAADFAGDNQLMGRRLRLAPELQRILVTDEQGYKYFGLSLPGLPIPTAVTTALGPGWRQLMPTGTELGVAAVDSDSLGAEPANIWLLDIGGASVPGSFLTEYPTPGDAAAVTIHQGLAYVADGGAGLQVLNYLAADTQGITPTITLESNFANGRAEAGRPMRLTALAQDDAQVRTVEFYLNGELVASDGSFPFEHRFITPANLFTVRAKATDTGGKVVWTPVQTRTIVADAAAPLVTTVVPLPDARVAPTSTVYAIFQEAMGAASLTPASFRLFSAGADEVVGTGDDVAITGGAVTYNAGTRSAALSFAGALPVGRYRALLTPTVGDGAGNTLAHPHFWDFQIVNVFPATRIVPGQREALAGFGETLAIDGDLLVVGAPGATVAGRQKQGAVYLFRRDGASPTGWTQFKQLAGSDGAQFDGFGDALALHGDTLLVAASRKRIGDEPQQGQVYLFMRNAGGADNWGEVARIADSPRRFDYFGSALAIRGNTFVVGANGMGAAFVYTRTATGSSDWALAKALESSGGINTGFGSAAAIRNDEQRIVVGAEEAGVTAPLNKDGAALVFDRNAGGAGNWGQVARLTASDAAGNANFGASVEIRDDLVVVGSFSKDLPEDLYGAGAVYLFIPDANQPSGWREVAALAEADSSNYYRYLGMGVAAGEGVVAAGAPGYWSGASEAPAGGLYLFRPAAGGGDGWVQTGLLTLGDIGQDVYLGKQVALDGETVAGGAPLADGNRGAVYLFPIPAAP